MDEFIAVALGFPTVCFTVPLALMVLYWITVTLGVLDIDVLGGAEASAGALDAAAGKLEGALDAAAGKMEGALDAAAGKMEGALDAATSQAHAAAEHLEAADTPVIALMSALRLRRAPVTVVLTVLMLVAFVASFMGTRHLVPLLPLPFFISGTLVFVLSLFIAWPIAAMVTFPMGPLYKSNPAITHAQLVGKRVLVSTSRVTETFGEAELADGGAGLLLQVRCTTPNDLAKGHEALLVAWHAERDAFDVEPMSSVLEGRGAA